VIVTDNGPAYKSEEFARFIKGRPFLRHVRTRYRSPQNNGVIEAFNQSAKYEHLFRRDIPDGIVLNEELENYRQIYDTIRAHERLGQITPLEIHLADPSQPRPTPGQIWAAEPVELHLFMPQTVQEP
jgi:putative transposase